MAHMTWYDHDGRIWKLMICSFVFLAFASPFQIVVDPFYTWDDSPEHDSPGAHFAHFSIIVGQIPFLSVKPPQKNLGSISSIPFQKISPNITFELLSGSELPMFRKLHESIPGARGAWGWWVAVAALDDGLSSGGRRATAWSHSGGRSQESAVEELRRGEIWWFWAVDPLLLDDQRWLVSLY